MDLVGISIAPLAVLMIFLSGLTLLTTLISKRLRTATALLMAGLASTDFMLGVALSVTAASFNEMYGHNGKTKGLTTTTTTPPPTTISATICTPGPLTAPSETLDWNDDTENLTDMMEQTCGSVIIIIIKDTRIALILV
jgi:hypothetical protein